MKRFPVFGAACCLALAVSSSAVASNCSLELESLSVPESVAAKVRYDVSISFRKSGRPKVLKGHFWWNSEGPFKLDVKQNGAKITSRLYTGNPNTYKLTVAIQYRCGLKKTLSNPVSAKLVVK